MRAEEWIRAAQERTGLETFDSDSFREPLDRLAAGIESRPERERIAAALTSELVAALANRLRVADHLRRHPELADAPLDVPIVVMGMPRTGTTLISYLLDCDPRWRSLLNWEALASLGTTISAGHAMALGHVDREFIHEVYPHQIAEHANRPLRLRESLPADKILDVYCAELLADPIGEMRRLYAWLGETLTPEVERAMRAWLEKDDARQAARPRYALADFGWSEAEVAPHFEEYLAHDPRARGA